MIHKVSEELLMITLKITIYSVSNILHPPRILRHKDNTWFSCINVICIN